MSMFSGTIRFYGNIGQKVEEMKEEKATLS